MSPPHLAVVLQEMEALGLRGIRDVQRPGSCNLGRQAEGPRDEAALTNDMQVPPPAAGAALQPEDPALLAGAARF